MELLPSIDLRNGHVVRLRRGAFEAETRYLTTAVQLCRQFAAAGARRVHVVDLDGARDGIAGNELIVHSIALLGPVGIQAGGGVRRREDVERLLGVGVERVVSGSIAVDSPDEVTAWIERFGPDRIVAALDVRLQKDGTPRLATQGWQQTSSLTLWEHVERLAAAGVRHVLCTDIARDGVMAGPNVALYHACVRRFPAIAWQASGGIRNAADLHALAATGVAAAISGRALIEERISPREMAPFLPAA